MIKNQIRKIKILIILILLPLAGCISDNNKPIPSLPDAFPLDTTVGDAEVEEFISVEQELAIAYPRGWAIADGKDIIYLASRESLFPWNSPSLIQPLYTIHVIGPYINRGNQRLNISQPTLDVAQFIADSRDGTIIQPAVSNDINGVDGASFLLEDEIGRHVYVVFLRITEHKLVVLSARGAASKSEEMQTVIDTIALNTHLAEN